MTPQEESDYPNRLQVGEEVVETCQTSCMRGMTGRVYRSDRGPSKGYLCVMWSNGMGTSVTHGTRRITDVQPREDAT